MRVVVGGAPEGRAPSIPRMTATSLTNCVFTKTVRMIPDHVRGPCGRGCNRRLIRGRMIGRERKHKRCSDYRTSLPLGQHMEQMLSLLRRCKRSWLCKDSQALPRGVAANTWSTASSVTVPVTIRIEHCTTDTKQSRLDSRCFAFALLGLEQWPRCQCGRKNGRPKWAIFSGRIDGGGPLSINTSGSESKARVRLTAMPTKTTSFGHSHNR